MSDIAIKVENLSKKYTIGKNVHGSLRQSIANIFKSKIKQEDFWALKDINFEIKKGEAIGVIGRNGAGKSTLLKILSKITQPTTGRVEMNGRVSSLLEVGTGFHHELTGRENIYLNGSLLGMSKSEIKSKFDEIVDFSGVEKFIDTPVKHYSSGMYVRLAFSVAAHLNTEILLIDEVLAVGDQEFQKKCLGKMDDVTQRGKTVLLVSHNYSFINRLCNTIIRLDEGVVDYWGNVIGAYKQNIDQVNLIEFENNVISNIIISSLDGGDRIISGVGMSISVSIAKDFNELKNILRIEILDFFGGVKFICNNRLVDCVLILKEGSKINIRIKSLPLMEGVYTMNVVLKNDLGVIDKNKNNIQFRVHPSIGIRQPNIKVHSFVDYSYEIQ